jgi:glycosyltransferase involved in cell wall biosynthesis
MVNNPLVSVIISTYNSERFIERKILDLLQQSIFNLIEIIIINSGSEQDEDSIVVKYCKLYGNIKYIKTKSRETIYKAWNRGIKIAKGKYITNANTDDLLRSDALEILSRNLEIYKDVGLVYADQYITSNTDSSFTDTSSLKVYYKLNFSMFRLLWRNIVGSQPMWRASIHFDDNIWFDENYEVSGDSEFEFRVSQKYKMLRVPEVLGIYYRSEYNENKEFRDMELSQGESLSVKEKNAKRFIEGMKESELRKLKWKILLNRFVPRILYSSVRVIIGKYLPYKQISPKIFWYWIASVYYEYKGDLPEARKCCEKYINTNDNLIKRQFERLKNLKV